MATVHRAIEALDTLRHAPSNDEQWPDTSLPDDSPQIIEEQLYRKLGEVALALDPTRMTPAVQTSSVRPTKCSSTPTFHAILSSRAEIGKEIFPRGYRHGRAEPGIRLIDDLAAERQREQVIFGTEPLVDMMELSGYALLMSEINGEGVWPDVREMWDRILSADAAPALASQLAAVLSAHENLFALTSGGIGRTERQMELARLSQPVASSIDVVPCQKSQPSLSRQRYRRRFCPHDPGHHRHDLADLFIVSVPGSAP